MSDQAAPHDPGERSTDHDADGDDVRRDAAADDASVSPSSNPSATQGIPGEQPKDDPDLEGEDRFDAG
ncbi:hypothetical protein [Cellulosimicrobium cellulans]|uniref:hypothetical protein n=1 Tax=Cellulosimicrobium cellulans TaxID=1710 RepID=UPI000848B6B8|nr:hypothetical protein [Cellulosimicrobium cellulans]